MNKDEKLQQATELLKKLSEEQLQRLIDYLQDSGRWHKVLHL